MFDNPKKELERLQAQLLAAEEDSFCDEIYDGPDTDEAFDDELTFMLGSAAPCDEADRQFSRRSAGFEIADDPYEMDSSRYVPAPKKKGIGGLLFVAVLELILAAALIAWWLGWIG